jgi:DNA invertase Pin-like site-specific DNA recombinase
MATKVRQGSAGIYVRISRDRATEVSTEVQEAECRTLCAQRGWKVAEVYIDAGKSAFTRTTARPAFERLRADVEAGHLDHVVAYKVDRLGRNVADFLGFVEAVEDAGATVTLASQDFDTATASGRLLRTILASFAEFESELKRERIGGSMAHKAANGRAHPGGTRLFGYNASRDELVSDEARELRAAARKLLAGKSLAEIARNMNSRGITTSTGGTWRPWVLGRTLRNPFFAGLRVYKGDTVQGDWPPIFDLDTHDQLLEILDDPGRTTATSTTTRHLLAGIVYCGLCGARMVSRPLRTGVDRYVCQESERGGCGRIMVDAERAETVVTDHVVDALARNADAIADAAGSIDIAALEREAADITGKLDELAEMWSAGEVTRSEWRAARDVLTDRADQLDRDRLTAASRAPALPRDIDGLAELWEDGTPDERRQLVRLVVSRVEIGPGTRGKWNPNRVKIVA